MKKILITALVCILIGLAAGWLLFHPSIEKKASQQRKILYYRDPMNPQITSPVPKKASDGMDFVPVYAEETSSSRERKIAYYKDPMHPWYTSDKPGKAPDCGMDLVPVYVGEDEVQGIHIDPGTVQNMGVTIEAAAKRQLSKTIRTTAMVDYDETKIYSVNTKIMGWVEKLYVDYTGKYVHANDPLLDIYSPELVTTQEEYLQALQYKKKLQQSAIDEARQEADQLVQSTLRRLQYWDIPQSEITSLEGRGTPKKALTVVSPANGIVTEKMVLQGQNIMPGMELFKIANISVVWINADIYQYELDWVKAGQNAEVTISYLPGKSFNGKITYIYPYLNMETKTGKVRIEVRNTANFDLKPGMYASVKIVSPLVVEAVTVPTRAIIRSGERNIVVKALGNGYFDPREVQLGVTTEDYAQIVEGIHEGENVVTSAQFLIDSESNLKAAIGLMQGHAEQSTAKPMEMQQADTSKAKMPSMEMKQSQPPSKKHDMSGMQKSENPNKTPGHDMGIMDMTDTTKMKQAETPKSETKVQYTCEMHPEVVSDKPGICPKCGMKLVVKKNSN